ncbi:unnamed protein product [Trypanosoma congolense IL3000]|uniref:WGS project CAEQ00000000 data, annotated contig 255 n=1 Tax=Trypanosoma congolense (strain IL3000) TaxID=1068625 RepID=F9WEE4_TRYCI|nr:unnamed protein product [Trypanosoma congolense IL3000]
MSLGRKRARSDDAYNVEVSGHPTRATYDSGVQQVHNPRGRSTSPGVNGEFFLIRVNGKSWRVDAAAPFINVTQLLDTPGLLLQDVTVPSCPIVLLPCPRTGNVTVTPNREYKLVKFIGEHLCLAGDLSRNGAHGPESAETNNGKSSNETGKKPSHLDIWPMTELYAFVCYLKDHGGSCLQDFLSLPVDKIQFTIPKG